MLPMRRTHVINRVRYGPTSGKLYVYPRAPRLKYAVPPPSCLPAYEPATILAEDEVTPQDQVAQDASFIGNDDFEEPCDPGSTKRSWRTRREPVEVEGLKALVEYLRSLGEDATSRKLRLPEAVEFLKEVCWEAGLQGTQQLSNPAGYKGLIKECPLLHLQPSPTNPVPTITLAEDEILQRLEQELAQLSLQEAGLKAGSWRWGLSEETVEVLETTARWLLHLQQEQEGEELGVDLGEAEEFISILQDETPLDDNELADLPQLLASCPLFTVTNTTITEYRPVARAPPPDPTPSSSPEPPSPSTPEPPLRDFYSYVRLPPPTDPLNSTPTRYASPKRRWRELEADLASSSSGFSPASLQDESSPFNNDGNVFSSTSSFKFPPRTTAPVPSSAEGDAEAAGEGADGGEDEMEAVEVVVQRVMVDASKLEAEGRRWLREFRKLTCHRSMRPIVQELASSNYIETTVAILAALEYGSWRNNLPDEKERAGVVAMVRDMMWPLEEYRTGTEYAVAFEEAELFMEGLGLKFSDEPGESLRELCLRSGVLRESYSPSYKTPVFVANTPLLVHSGKALQLLQEISNQVAVCKLQQLLAYPFIADEEDIRSQLDYSAFKVAGEGVTAGRAVEERRGQPQGQEEEVAKPGVAAEPAVESVVLVDEPSSDVAQAAQLVVKVEESGGLVGSEDGGVDRVNGYGYRGDVDGAEVAWSAPEAEVQEQEVAVNGWEAASGSTAVGEAEVVEGSGKRASWLEDMSEYGYGAGVEASRPIGSTAGFDDGGYAGVSREGDTSGEAAEAAPAEAEAEASTSTYEDFIEYGTVKYGSLRWTGTERRRQKQISLVLTGGDLDKMLRHLEECAEEAAKERAEGGGKEKRRRRPRLTLMEIEAPSAGGHSDTAYWVNVSALRAQGKKDELLTALRPFLEGGARPSKPRPEDVEAPATAEQDPPVPDQ